MHAPLPGTLPLGRALMFGTLRVSGSRSGDLPLEPLLHACEAVYPDITDELTGRRRPI